MGLSNRILEMVSLEGKVAVITGGAAGIGLGTAKVLASAGALVVLLDINDLLGKQAEEEINSLGGQARYLHCDVTSGADCKKISDLIIADHRKVDILFNNAGIAVRKNIVNCQEEEWDLAIGVNLKGVYLASHYFIPHMITNGGGSVINTGSGWSLKGGPDAVSYCASKGAVLNLTRAMAIDHGKHNIRVNCICPGDVDTALLRSECAQLGENEEVFMAEAADRPLRRVGTTEDIGMAVLFFASEMSSWVTGSHLVVDGGGLA